MGKIALIAGRIEWTDQTQREQLLLNAIVAIAGLRDEGHYAVIKYNLLEQLNDMLLKQNYPPMFANNGKISREKADTIEGGSREG